MFGKLRDIRFVVEKISSENNIRCYILTDKETGIQYLASWVSTGGGITPLLDENGNVSKVDI
ncbi:DUF6440 family protein [Staphylococcus petrasii]|uniref:DUF6440 family protein n=1 Tax=Staphylococcus petrasii TaxID=1276936 RepID=UPI001F57358F|nr:DUF6440 family protein [Staphylococcus petrasii]MCI2773822.1 DUF6440 family protein [Staphylococcus petrasii]